jgi:hypothetical protein
MNKKKAKLLFKHNSFDVIEDGDYVLCAVSGKEINLENLNYWNVEFQEAYFSPIEVNKKFKS